MRIKVTQTMMFEVTQKSQKSQKAMRMEEHTEILLYSLRE